MDLEADRNGNRVTRRRCNKGGGRNVSRLSAVPPRRDLGEWLDQPESIRLDLAPNLRDIRRLNSWFGGTSLALRHVRALCGDRPRVTILDVATGSADIPMALARWARRYRRSVNVTACDISGDILNEARRIVGGESISLVQADARALPWSDGTFDIVLCCLALHHFSPQEAEIVMAELWRLCRVGIVVVDLYRSYPAYVGAWLSTRTVARNRVTRHDGPISVLRSYTREEMAEMARRAAVSNARVRYHAFFRQALVACKESAPC